MPVHISIDGDDYRQALAELRGLSGGLVPVLATMPAPGGEVSDATQANMGDGKDVVVETAKPVRGGRKSKPAEAAPQPDTQAIQTGAERVETKPEPQPEAKPLTLDDVRAAAGRYVQKFGMDAAQADVGKLLGDVAGADVKNISGLDGKPQDVIAKVIATVDAAIAADKKYAAASVL